MSNCTLCRANVDNYYHLVANTALQEIFERITNGKLGTNSQSTTLCYICHSQLQRCLKLYKMSQKAEETFVYLISNNKEVSPEQLTVLNLGLQSLNNTTTDLIVTIQGYQLLKEEIIDEDIDGDSQKVDQKMEFSNTACRVCLAGQSKMLCTNSIGLKDIFEKVTNLTLVAEERPATVCYICVAHLKRCQRLVQMSSIAEKMLSLQTNGVHFTRKICTNKLNPEIAHNLSISTTSIVSLYSDAPTVPVKMEIKEEPDVFNDHKLHIIISIKPDFLCHICSKTYKSEAYLEKHIKNHTLEKQFSCHQCDAKFKTKSILTKHMKKHDKYVCDYCEKEFNIKELLVRHLRIHTGFRPYACETCNKTFTYIGSYRQHVKTHTDDKPYSCTKCEAKFCNTFTLNRHMSVHTGRNFTCGYCNKIYHLKSLLQRHIKIHTNDRPYACTSCDKAFYDKFNLIIHIRSHTGEKPFKCITCDKKFADESNMLRHTKTHKEKEFTCNICNLKVTRKFILQSHMRHHTGIKPYRCIKCSKSFISNIILQRHIKTHSIINAFTCSICNKEFKRQATLDEHMCVHTGENPLKCDKCNKKFAKHRHLRQHKKTHTDEKPHACQECGRMFRDRRNMERHRTIHSTEMPFVCKVCSKGFRRADGLLRHSKLHDKSES